MNKERIICWWSGGVTSAVACRIAIDLYGLDRCDIVFIDTHNEDDDTYRFKKDCENWYGKEIETISSSKYESVQDVWYSHESLNVANGAICSSELKKQVRIRFQKTRDIEYQVFGFDMDEVNRAKNIKKNYPKAKPIFPLLLMGLVKKETIKIIQDAGIEVPRMYNLGFTNNNCFKTGCVQGGIGYWKKIQREYPEKFEAMAKVEHELTESKGKPVTMLKDQSKIAKAMGLELVFLKKHNDYPDHKCIDDMEGREVENLMECNGFCGTQIPLL